MLSFRGSSRPSGPTCVSYVSCISRSALPLVPPGKPFLSSAAAAAKSLQSCPTLCDFIDGSPPGSPIPGILQARTLEWVAISFSNAWRWKVKVKSLSRVRLLATPWTAAYQAPPSMGFSRQEYWSGCHCCIHMRNDSWTFSSCKTETLYPLNNSSFPPLSPYICIFKSSYTYFVSNIQSLWNKMILCR